MSSLVGTDLIRVLRSIGYEDCLSCSMLPTTLNDNPPEYAAENLDDLADKLEERATRRGLAFNRRGALAAIRMAIDGATDIVDEDLIAWRDGIRIAKDERKRQAPVKAQEFPPIVVSEAMLEQRRLRAERNVP